MATRMSRVSTFRAGLRGCMVLWVALAALLILAAPSAAAVPRLKGQSGGAQVSEAAASDAQQRLLREDEAVHFQVVCGPSRNTRAIFSHVLRACVDAVHVAASAVRGGDLLKVQQVGRRPSTVVTVGVTGARTARCRSGTGAARAAGTSRRPPTPWRPRRSAPRRSLSSPWATTFTPAA